MGKTGGPYSSQHHSLLGARGVTTNCLVVSGLPNWCDGLRNRPKGTDASHLGERLFATAGSITCQASLSMEFSRQEHWSGSPFPSPGDLPHPGMEPGSVTVQADSLPLSHQGSPHPFLHLPTKTEQHHLLGIHHARFTVTLPLTDIYFVGGGSETHSSCS